MLRLFCLFISEKIPLIVQAVQWRCLTVWIGLMLLPILPLLRKAQKVNFLHTTQILREIDFD